MDFAAGIMRKSEGSSRKKPVWEYTVVLIRANDAAEAERKAYEFGHRTESRYVAVDGNEVRWKCIAIHNVQPVTPTDGQDVAEVFTLFLRNEEARSILEPIDAGSVAEPTRTR